MAKIAPCVTEYIQEVKNDATPTDWCLLQFERPNQIIGVGKGKGGMKELKTRLADDKVMYALLRTVSGDQESKRTKFVFIQWTGSECGPLVRGQASGMKPEAIRVMNGFHVEVHIDDVDMLTEDDVAKRLKAAGGADYDTGSNKGGNYFSEGAKSIKTRALKNFTQKANSNAMGSVPAKTSTPLAKFAPVARSVNVAGRSGSGSGSNSPVFGPKSKSGNVEPEAHIDVRKFASFFEAQANALQSGA